MKRDDDSKEIQVKAVIENIDYLVQVVNVQDVMVNSASCAATTLKLELFDMRRFP